MKVNLKKFLSALVISASVLSVGQVIAAQEPSEPVACKVSVESIATAKQELSKAAEISHVALKAKVKTLLRSACAETIAVALSELGISPALALQAMSEAGVPVADVVGFLVAADPKNSPAIIAAAVKAYPKDELAIIQAAVGAGGSLDDTLPATAAGPASIVAVSPSNPRASSGGSSGGGGGGVVTQPTPVSPN